MIPNRKAPNVFADTKKFIELAQPDHITPLGAQPAIKTLQLIKHLVNEEVNKEFMVNLEAMIASGNISFEQMVQFLDDAIDSIYVLAWGIAALSLPGEAAWNEVQRANMSKFPLVKDQPHDELMAAPALPMPAELPEYKDIKVRWNVRQGHFVLTNEETGKVVKPKGFNKPDIFEVVMNLLAMKKLRENPSLISDPLLKDYFHEMEKRREQGEIDA